MVQPVRNNLFPLIARRYTRIDAGWPIRSFRGFVINGLQEPKYFQMNIAKRLTQEEVNVTEVERSVSNTTMQRYLPYMPIWFGLIVNTLIYTTVILAIMWLLIAARSKIRLRRKLCPTCKYPIGVSVVCTECGTALDESALHCASTRRPEAVR